MLERNACPIIVEAAAARAWLSRMNDCHKGRRSVIDRLGDDCYVFEGFRGLVFTATLSECTPSSGFPHSSESGPLREADARRESVDIMVCRYGASAAGLSQENRRDND